VSGLGWRLPALLVVVALLAMVGLARIGMKEAPALPPSPALLRSPSSVAVANPSQPASDDAKRSNPPVLLSQPSFVQFAYSPWPERYADGIPRSVGGVPVMRLNTAVDQARLASDGRTGSVLVGGWFQPTAPAVSGCSPQGFEPWCSEETAADTPALLGRAQSATVSGMPAVTGPAIVQATVAAACSTNQPPSIDTYCDFRLAVDQVVWQGDAYTDTAPIAVGPLISVISSTMWFDPIPYQARPSCHVTRPAQSYTTYSYGDVEMVFVFPTTGDREAHGAETIASRPDDQTGSRCAPVPPLTGSSGWISQDNVLIRVIDAAGEPGRTILSLLEQLSAAAASE
jgi:hypothetical protein